MADLFRKSSIEKLANPEQLDKAITVSSSMSWLALLGVTFVIIVTAVWSVIGTLPTTVTVSGIIVNPTDTGAVYAETSGIITEIVKQSGEKLSQNDVIAKMKNSSGEECTITAKQAGTLTDILITVNTQVYAGTEVARYTPKGNFDQVLVCYIPLAMINQLEEDMQVLVYPCAIDSQKYGHMEAEIKYIGEYAATTSNMRYVVGADNMIAEQFVTKGPVVAVTCVMKEDSSTESGYYWSSENAEDLTIANGTFVSAKIVTEECAPITKLIRNIKEKLED